MASTCTHITSVSSISRATEVTSGASLIGLTVMTKVSVTSLSPPLEGLVSQVLWRRTAVVAGRLGRGRGFGRRQYRLIGVPLADTKLCHQAVSNALGVHPLRQKARDRVGQELLYGKSFRSGHEDDRKI